MGAFSIGRSSEEIPAEPWKIDNDGLIAESKGHFDSEEYEHQLKEGVKGSDQDKRYKNVLKSHEKWHIVATWKS